ncbi:MAG: phosphatase [Bacteroidia bacterium]|nr:phosphatase [Bacteroidia bacterium]MCZ2277338.1 phosphatase [Bacteroidia bacterium]
MRIALIDCGTNTFHLLIAEISEQNKINYLTKEQVPVKLGEGGITTGMITDAAFDRGIQCLENFASIIRKSNVVTVQAFGTAILRKAKNRDAFLQAAKEKTGIEFSVIEGSREAELIYIAVNHATPLKGTELIMDIGGGSTELIVADSTTIRWKKSYEAGAALLRDKFNPSDRITSDEIKEMEKWFAEIFSEFIIQWKGKISVLNGSAGSFDTFLKLSWMHGGGSKPAEGSVSAEIPLHSFNHVYQQLITSTRLERLQMKGLPEFRADMIVPAVVLLNFILREMDIKTIVWSAYSLKEGMLFNTIRNL